MIRSAGDCAAGAGRFRLQPIKINSERAKTCLDVALAKMKRVVGKLVPTSKAGHTRQLDTAKGWFIVPEDFNQPLPKDVEESFWN